MEKKNNINEIKISKVQPKNGLVGFASLVFENAFYLSSIGIFQRPNGGYRLAYPTRKNTEKRLNYFFPVNKQVAHQMEQEIIKAFLKLKD